MTRIGPTGTSKYHAPPEGVVSTSSTTRGDSSTSRGRGSAAEGRLAGDELEPDDDPAAGGGRGVDAVMEQPDRLARNARLVRRDRAERRRREPAVLDVVDADDRDVVGHPDPLPAQRMQCAERELVVEAQHGVRTLAEQGVHCQGALTTAVAVHLAR